MKGKAMPTLRDGTVIDERFNAVHFFNPQECLTFYGMPRVVEYLTIHHWGNLGQNFDDVVRFLCSRRDNNPTSAHVVIEAKRAASIISPDDVAFHSGNATGNARSIGLELRPEATDEDYVTAAAYIAYLRGIYGDVPLRKHSDWYATACPGKWDLVRLDKMARANTTPVAPRPVQPAPVKPAPKPVVKAPVKRDPNRELNWIVEKGDSLSKIAKHYYGEASTATVNRLAAYNGIKQVNQISVGQRVFIPGPVFWTIEKPDTLTSIAKYYGMDPDVLARNNGLPNRHAEIFVGNVLKII